MGTEIREIEQNRLAFSSDPRKMPTPPSELVRKAPEKGVGSLLGTVLSECVTAPLLPHLPLEESE